MRGTWPLLHFTMNSVKFVVFAICAGIAFANEESQIPSNAQAIVDVSELNELKIKLGEPLSNLRKEYKELFNHFYLNTIRQATKEETDAGVIYTIGVLLGNPPVNCELTLFETEAEYTLHSQCGGYRFRNGIKPISGPRIKREIDEDALAHGVSREVQFAEFDHLELKIRGILEQLHEEYLDSSHLVFSRIISGQLEIELSKIARWSLDVEFILPSEELAVCDVVILEQEWTEYHDVSIKCDDEHTFRIEHGSRQD